MKEFFSGLVKGLIMFVLIVSISAAKKRICVIDFEDKTSGQHHGWREVGKGMSDMLVTSLIKSNKFMVIEREKLTKIMEEQKLGATGAVTPQTAAKIGTLLGVSYIVTGSVSEFGIKESKLGIGNLGGLLPFGGGIDTRTNTAKVAVDIRLIDTSTSQIIRAEKGEGEESSTGVSIDLSIAPSVDFGKDGFDETVIGKATRKAIDIVAKVIIEEEAKMPWTARIMKISGNQIYLNSGEEDGEKVGRIMGIYRRGEELVDPDTGVSLGAEEKKMGIAKTVKVEKKFSIAETDAKDLLQSDYLKEEK
ncbi:MAG: CsgG/HfaB family protein [Candidatus Firestonebacteria bacterium]